MITRVLNADDDEATAVVAESRCQLLHVVAGDAGITLGLLSFVVGFGASDRAGKDGQLAGLAFLRVTT